MSIDIERRLPASYGRADGRPLAPV